MVQSSVWLNGKPHPDAAVRMFCFPYAGAGSVVFHGWRRALPELDVCGVELPGRFERAREPPAASIEELVQQLELHLEPYLNVTPTVLFGYSFGATLAFELARALRRRGRPVAGLIVAARAAPQLARPLTLSQLNDDELLRRAQLQYGVIPSALLSDPDMRRYVANALRSDLRLLERHQYVPGEPLACPILACAGLEDRSTTPDTVAAWSEQTSGEFRLETFASGHFFIRSHAPQLIERIDAFVRRQIRPAHVPTVRSALP